MNMHFFSFLFAACKFTTAISYKFLNAYLCITIPVKIVTTFKLLQSLLGVMFSFCYWEPYKAIQQKYVLLAYSLAGFKDGVQTMLEVMMTTV